MHAGRTDCRGINLSIVLEFSVEAVFGMMRWMTGIPGVPVHSQCNPRVAQIIQRWFDTELKCMIDQLYK